MTEPTYEELLQESHALALKLKAAREREVEAAIIEINKTMQKLGMTVADLTRGGAPSPIATKSRLAAKYRNPATGDVWAGRGHQPIWFKTAIAGGAKAEDFLVR